MARRFVWKRRAFDLPALICLPPDYKASRADQSVQNSCVGWVELKVTNGHGLVLNNKRWIKTSQINRAMQSAGQGRDGPCNGI